MSARRSTSKRRVLVVTGARSEFGLLRPVMEAIQKHKTLELLVVVAGEHLLRPAYTWKEVAAEYRIDARVPMQRAGEKDRLQHAAACARGMEGFAAAFKKLKPDWVVVLGDRIEAFAAASAASIGGIGVCHIHGGDRAEGIADEAMRHAITKLAHLHCAATKTSAGRIVAMGERKANVHVTGSPAIDGLRDIAPMTDDEVVEIGAMRMPGHWDLPDQVLLMHPDGSADDPVSAVRRLLYLERQGWLAARTVAFMPNHDPGREHLVRFLWRRYSGRHWRLVEHLARDRFIALLKWMAKNRVPLVGNSSAGLIECAALGVVAFNIGPRQAGRERAGNVLDFKGDGRDPAPPTPALARTVRRVDSGGVVRLPLIESGLSVKMREVTTRIRPSRRFGDGRAGARIAALLARLDPRAGALVRKRNSY